MADPATFQDTSPRHRLPLLFAAQAQKEVVVNEALSLLDAIVQPAILGEQDSPPTNPAEGDGWLVGATPTGDWSAHAGELAVYSGGDWLFAMPSAGMQVWDSSLQQFRLFDDGWSTATAPAPPSGGTTVDIESRQAISGIISVLRESGILPAN